MPFVRRVVDGMEGSLFPFAHLIRSDEMVITMTIKAVMNGICLSSIEKDIIISILYNNQNKKKISLFQRIGKLKLKSEQNTK